jgi:hypothetical protein
MVAAYPLGLLTSMTLLAASGPARASDVDSEHLFGFTEGADIGKAGSAKPKPKPSAVFASRPALTQR